MGKVGLGRRPGRQDPFQLLPSPARRSISFRRASRTGSTPRPRREKSVTNSTFRRCGRRLVGAGARRERRAGGWSERVGRLDFGRVRASIQRRPDGDRWSRGSSPSEASPRTPASASRRRRDGWSFRTPWSSPRPARESRSRSASTGSRHCSHGPGAWSRRPTVGRGPDPGRGPVAGPAAQPGERDRVQGIGRASIRPRRPVQDAGQASPQARISRQRPGAWLRAGGVAVAGRRGGRGPRSDAHPVDRPPRRRSAGWSTRPAGRSSGPRSSSRATVRRRRGASPTPRAGSGSPRSDLPALLFVAKEGYRFFGRRIESGAQSVQFVLRRLDEPPASPLGSAPSPVAREEERAIARELIAQARKAAKRAEIRPGSRHGSTRPRRSSIPIE